MLCVVRHSRLLLIRRPLSTAIRAHATAPPCPVDSAESTSSGYRPAHPCLAIQLNRQRVGPLGFGTSEHENSQRRIHREGGPRVSIGTPPGSAPGPCLPSPHALGGGVQRTCPPRVARISLPCGTRCSGPCALLGRARKATPTPGAELDREVRRPAVMDDEAEVTPVCLDYDIVGAVVRIGVVVAAVLDLFS